MPEFIPIQDRDAWATIRGYFYQVQVTVQRWLDLEPEERLQLECGEDIDRIGKVVAGRPDPEQEALRTLEQVKYRQKSLTLRAPEAVAALVSFHRHRIANAGVRLKFRYITNAAVACEALSQVPDGGPAIGAWEQVRTGLSPDFDYGPTLDGLRSTLLTATRPPSIAEANWNDFRQYISNASDGEFLSFVRSFEWGTDSTPFEAIAGVIEQRLLEMGRASSSAEARSSYERLVIFVLNRLSLRGPKVLGLDDLDVACSALPLTSADRRITQLLEHLSASATQSSEEIRETKQIVSDIQDTVRGIASGQLGGVRATSGLSRRVR